MVDHGNKRLSADSRACTAAHLRRQPKAVEGRPTWLCACCGLRSRCAWSRSFASPILTAMALVRRDSRWPSSLRWWRIRRSGVGRAMLSCECDDQRNMGGRRECDVPPSREEGARPRRYHLRWWCWASRPHRWLEWGQGSEGLQQEKPGRSGGSRWSCACCGRRSMDARADRIAAPTLVEGRHLSARAVLSVLGWQRIAQLADVDAVQDQDVGEYAGEKGVRHYVRARS